MASDDTHSFASDALRRGGRALPRGRWASACLTGCLLVAMWFDARAQARPDETEAHHRHVCEVAADVIPYSVGDWLGRRVPSAPSVVAMLHPNVLETRVYENSRTRESATLVVVHCGDARDLLGHYPPVCYPSHGLTTLSAVPRDWTVGDETITGMRYRFDSAEGGSAAETVVDNVMVPPSGEYARDMDAVNMVCKDRYLRRYGAAELQVVTDGSMSDDRRDEVFRTLVAPLLPLLKSVRAEVKGD